MSTRNRRLTRTIAGALAVFALAAPAANALPGEMTQGSPHPQGDAKSQEPLPFDPTAQEPRPTVTRAIDDGFDVGSAAIGAGGAAVILLVSGAGAVAVSHRNRRVGLAG